ncbi:MAG: hypothetical protein HC922_09150 [Leptolyngbyaceae cyanobacterium SM2_3_12]|nr:hypothetical protein [Leptolyngbyaceae cyanobacterium SM2_3_12]
MTFTLFKPLRHAITQLPLGWLVVMPLVPSALGAMILAGYLAQGRYNWSQGLSYCCFCPWRPGQVWPG